MYQYCGVEMLKMLEHPMLRPNTPQHSMIPLQYGITFTRYTSAKPPIRNSTNQTEHYIVILSNSPNIIQV